VRIVWVESKEVSLRDGDGRRRIVLGLSGRVRGLVLRGGFRRGLCIPGLSISSVLHEGIYLSSQLTRKRHIMN